MKTYREVEVFSNSTLDGGDNQLHAAVVLSPGKVTIIHWIGGCVGPRAGLDTAVAKRKKPFLTPAGSRILVYKTDVFTRATEICSSTDIV
jgi:hypothetical protein